MDQATKPRTLEIELNNRPVSLPDEPGRDETTGTEIKAAAIDQGVAIRADFPLFVVQGHKLEPVADDDTIHVHRGQKFRAVAPDDNS
jgi:hypothetical protein